MRQPRRWSAQANRTRIYIAIAAASPVGLKRAEIAEQLQRSVGKKLLDEALRTLAQELWVYRAFGTGRYLVDDRCQVPPLDDDAIDALVLAVLQTMPGGASEDTVRQDARISAAQCTASLGRLRNAGRIELAMFSSGGEGWRCVEFSAADACDERAGDLIAVPVMAEVDIDAVRAHQPQDAERAGISIGADSSMSIACHGFRVVLPAPVVASILDYVRDMPALMPSRTIAQRAEGAAQ